MRSHLFTTPLAALALSASALVAQPTQRPVRQWMVSISHGDAVGKSAGPVERAMRDGGFNDFDDFCFSDCLPYPRSYAGSGSGLLTVRRSIRPHLQVVAMYGTASLTETFGFMADTAAFSLGNHLFIKQSVRMGALLAGISTRSGATWLAAGPAVFQPRFQVTSHQGGPNQSQLRVGSTFAAGIGTRQRFFVELQGQYRLVGSVDLEPMEVQSSPGAPLAGLPGTSVNFDHYTIQLGAGVRW